MKKGGRREIVPFLVRYEVIDREEKARHDEYLSTCARSGEH